MQENKTSNLSFSDLKNGWFTINDCYKTVNIHSLPKMEPLNSAEKHLITMAFYAIIFQGKKPEMFPRDVGGALVVFLYNNLRILGYEHRNELAFMDSDKLPENIRDTMKPKDECPQQLIDTGNELKKWAEHVMALNGMNEAFEKSTNGITAEMAKKVGELVANQMISESTWNYKKNRQHLSELSAKIYLDSEENKLIAMFALLFRLVVQTPHQIMNYYERKSEEILTKWALFYSSRTLIKKQLCKKYLFQIHQRFVQLRSAITHHVAIGLIALKCEEDYNGLAHVAYKELEMWFVSRMEFHGLALLDLWKEKTNLEYVRTLQDFYEMFRKIMLTTNATQLIGILSSLLIYLWVHLEGEEDDEGIEIVKYMAAQLLNLSEEPTIELDLPNFNKYDRLLGRLAKCFSPKYLPWTAFKYNCDTSALLLGYVQGLKKNEPDDMDPQGIYIGPDRIELYRKDAFISSIFLEALETAQNDILWRSKKKEGLVSVKLIGFLIGEEGAWELDDNLYSEIMRQVLIKRKQKKEEEKAAKRERLLVLELENGSEI